MKHLSLVVIAEEPRREAIKTCLPRRGAVQLAGEIGETAGLALLPGLAPDIVVLDCAALGFNSLMILPWLHGLPGAPQVVALGAAGSAREEQYLRALGADEYATLDALAPVLAALPASVAPTHVSPIRAA